MPRRKLLTGFLLAAGSLAGTVLFRRRAARRRERLDLYFEDGSVVSLDDGNPSADRLIALVHQVLGAARSGP